MMRQHLALFICLSILNGFSKIFADEQNPCTPNPCENGAFCSVDSEYSNGFICACKVGYYGENCEFDQCTFVCNDNQVCVRSNEVITCKDKEDDIDQCNIVCNDNQVCVRGDGVVTCKDKEGIIHNRDPCEPNPCENGASCTVDSEFDDEFFCTCKVGYYGENCEFDQCDFACNDSQVCVREKEVIICKDKEKITDDRDPCEPNLCKNGASCIINSESDNGFSCVCKGGYFGQKCEFDLCNSACADNEVCLRGDQSITCKIQEEIGDSKGPCDPNLCKNGASCTVSNESDNGFSCACKGGYFGEKCEFDLCNFACTDNEVCIRGDQSITCKVKEEIKDDKDPCEPNPCKNDALCIVNSEFANGFSCICKVGYFGEKCELDQCSLACNDNQVCLREVEGITCKDKEPCEPNLCRNGGLCAVGSEPDDGFFCICKVGYYGEYCENDQCEFLCNVNQLCIRGDEDITCMDKEEIKRDKDESEDLTAAVSVIASSSLTKTAHVKADVFENAFKTQAVEEISNRNELLRRFTTLPRRKRPFYNYFNNIKKSRSIEEGIVTHVSTIDFSSISLESTAENITDEDYTNFTKAVSRSLFHNNTVKISNVSASTTVTIPITETSQQTSDGITTNDSTSIFASTTETISSTSGSCDSNPCKNGASCIVESDTDEFICTCKVGYFGENCEHDQCEFLCKDNQVCVRGNENITCKEKEVTDPCETIPCQNDAICTVDAEFIDGFFCTCKIGYYGEKCELDQCTFECNTNQECVRGPKDITCKDKDDDTDDPTTAEPTSANPTSTDTITTHTTATTTTTRPASTTLTTTSENTFKSTKPPKSELSISTPSVDLTSEKTTKYANFTETTPSSSKKTSSSHTSVITKLTTILTTKISSNKTQKTSSGSTSDDFPTSKYVANTTFDKASDETSHISSKISAPITSTLKTTSVEFHETTNSVINNNTVTSVSTTNVTNFSKSTSRSSSQISSVSTVSMSTSKTSSDIDVKSTSEKPWTEMLRSTESKRRTETPNFKSTAAFVSTTQIINNTSDKSEDSENDINRTNASSSKITTYASLGTACFAGIVAFAAGGWYFKRQCRRRRETDYRECDSSSETSRNSYSNHSFP